MSTTGNQGTGGASKIPTPSARRSIHSHPQCPFAFAEAMVGYGLNNRGVLQDSSQLRANQSNGTDEVDNIFSKPSQPIGPLFAHSKNNRRNSLKKHVQLEQHSEDDCNLSKSLPAKLPSQLYCSSDGDSDGENNRSDASYYATSLSSSSSPANRSPQQTNGYHLSSNESSPVNRTPVFNGRTPDNRSYLERSGSVRDKSQSSVQNTYLVHFLILLSTVVALYFSMFNTTYETDKVVYDESRFYEDIDSLGSKYNIDENSLLRMQTGIATIFEKEDAGSFIFVYNSKDNISPSEFDKFINDVSVTTSKYLRNESTQFHSYTTIEGAALDESGLSEHGELICRYKLDVSRSGVMLVRQVHAVPGELAMAFHYYCDEYNPLVKRSAIFFTLDIAKCQTSSDKKSTHAVIEKCLAQKWSGGVPTDSIGPLLTRVVSVVIDLTTVF